MKITIAQQIKNARLEKGWTQYELSKRIDVIPMSIYSWEANKRIPGGKYILKLQEVLGVMFSSPESNTDADT